MRNWKSLFVAAFGVSAFSLWALTPNMVISVDGDALAKHPQVVKYRSEFDAKANAAGESTVNRMLDGNNLNEEMLRNRISVYLDMNSRKGVFVVDTAEGKAPEMFDLFCKSLNFKDGGKKSEIAGYAAVSGEVAGGKPAVVLLRSPSQIQIQQDGSDAIPLNFAEINKSLILAAKSPRLVNIAVIPPPELLSSSSIPQLQSLRIVTLGIENTKPEAELALEGVFNDNESAQMVNSMLEVMMFAAQQNQNIDTRLLTNIRGDVTDGKVSFRRTIDAEFIDGVTAQVQSMLSPAIGGAAPEGGAKTQETTAPVAEPAAK